MITSTNTTAAFLRLFKLGDVAMQAGDYSIQAIVLDPEKPDEHPPRTASMLVHVHPLTPVPGASRSVTVPLSELTRVLAYDKLTAMPLHDYLVEDMLADPMIRIIMRADGVSEDDLRGYYSAVGGSARPKNVRCAREDIVGSVREPEISQHCRKASRPGIGE